jgi:colanic acid biosynthesis glycosyl transferase WcaI
MALTNTSPLLAGAAERRLDPKGAARWPVPISRSVVIFAHDLAAALASLVLAFLLRESGQLIWADVRVLVHAVPLFLALAGASFLAFGLHRRIWGCTSISDLGAVVKASTWAVLLFVAICLAAGRMTEVPPGIWIIQWLILVVLLCGARLAYRFAKIKARRARAGAPGAQATRDVPVLLYGCGPMASLFVGAVQSTPGTNVRVVGIVDDAGTPRGRRVHNVPVLGGAQDLDRIIADLAVQGIHPQRLVMTRTAGGLSPEGLLLAEHCRARHGVELHFLPDMLGLPASEVASAPRPCERAYFRARRPLELGVSALALLMLLPLLGLIALLVLADVGRPILFRQVRPGQSMRPFTLYKFRTLRAPCAAQAAPVPHPEPASLVGRTLRRTRLDELPQLVNVLRGEMSFIGPRPLLPRELPDRATPRSAIRPGITGWAQVHGGRNLRVEEKIALDAWYLDHANPWIDLRIIGRTLKMMACGRELDRLELDLARPDETGCQRVVVVNRFFHPDTSATSQLLTDLVDTLDGRGFRVTVLAGRHGYLNTGAVLPAREWRAGIEVRRLQHTGFGRFSLPGRTLDGATFAASAFLALLIGARPGDVILAKTDPPLISVLAWLAARLTGARLVNWCQDLFPETAAAIGLPFARGPVGTTLRALRNASLRGAEMNVALSPGMAARLAAERVPPERLTVIPNWADGELIRPLAPQDNPLRAAWGLGERFVIGYSGNLGCAHAVDPVLELMTLLEDEPGLVFLFIGAGAGHRNLRAAIAGRRLENVVFRPYQDRAQLPQSLTAPDVHLVTLRPGWEGLVMPSKLYGALAAGRPVVFIGDPTGDAARIVRGGPGLVASPDAMPALAAEIRALRRDPARLARMGAAARQAYEACPRDASLDAWTRCLRAAGLAAAARPLPQAVPAE